MLLIDENLYYRLVARLGVDFPGITAVAKAAGLGEGTPDQIVWEYAKAQNLAILTKDKDFVEYWQRFGPPPKIVRIEVGNCRPANIEALIKRNKNEIHRFIRNPDNNGLLILRDA